MRKSTELALTSLVVVVALLALGGTSNADWGGGSIGESDGTEGRTCGDLDGEVGAPWAWDAPSGANTNQMSSKGYVGVKWTGNDPSSGSLNKTDKVTNSISHSYRYLSGNENFNSEIDLNVSFSVGGSASAQTQGSWAWDWSGTSSHEDPVIFWWSSESGWDDGTTLVGDQDTNGTVTGGHNATGGTVTGSGTAGKFKKTITYVVGDATKVMWAVTFSSQATQAECQNTSITSENYVKLTFTFDTKVSY